MAKTKYPAKRSGKGKKSSMSTLKTGDVFVKTLGGPLFIFLNSGSSQYSYRNAKTGKMIRTKRNVKVYKLWNIKKGGING